MGVTPCGGKETNTYHTINLCLRPVYRRALLTQRRAVAVAEETWSRRTGGGGIERTSWIGGGLPASTFYRCAVFALNNSPRVPEDKRPSRLLEIIKRTPSSRSVVWSSHMVGTLYLAFFFRDFVRFRGRKSRLAAPTPGWRQPRRRRKKRRRRRPRRRRKGIRRTSTRCSRAFVLSCVRSFVRSFVRSLVGWWM